ncbi:MAG: glycoside hydrolase family 127 protein, partial [Clostridia bacterium]|nr:glycoside hydrolase family 127 protein [Clostridia bacterium]
RTNNEEAHMFGLEPHFGCCTANFNQGWPKFVLSSFMYKDDEVINVVPVPSVLDCDKASISLETNYPFENSFKYVVEAKGAFTFKIRIPGFAQKLTVNGKESEGNELCFEFNDGDKKEICVSFETTPYFEKRPHALNTVKCGSLVFSLPVKYEKKMYEYEKNGVERKFPYCDYEYIPVSPWNYAYCSNELVVHNNKISDVPFSSDKPPVTIRAKVKNIDWGLEDGYETVCAKIPNSVAPLSEEKEIDLYPYGCSKLRMTELPVVD